MSLHLVLITGMSGSGKSVALNALEDSGYYCIDNLPPELLLPFVGLAREQGRKSVAVAVDVRSARSLPQVPKGLATLQNEGVRVRSLFLEATTETLVRRFSESRRRHPLARDAAQTHHYALSEAIDLERELLSELRLNAHIIDTSLIRANQLQSYVKKLIDAPASPLTLVFESSGNRTTRWEHNFQRGVGVPDQSAALLGLPEGVETLGWLCLGWPDERPPEPGLQRAAWSTRLPLEEVLLRDRWPEGDGPVLAAPVSHLRGPAPERLTSAHQSGAENGLIRTSLAAYRALTRSRSFGLSISTMSARSMRLCSSRSSAPAIRPWPRPGVRRTRCTNTSCRQMVSRGGTVRAALTAPAAFLVGTVVTM